MVSFEEKGIEALSQEIMPWTHGMDIICKIYSWLHREEIPKKSLANFLKGDGYDVN